MTKSSRAIGGSRNSELITYGLMLVDYNWNLQDIETVVMERNDKTSNPLSTDEVTTTILKSIRAKVHSRDNS